MLQKKGWDIFFVDKMAVGFKHASSTSKTITTTIQLGHLCHQGTEVKYMI